MGPLVVAAVLVEDDRLFREWGVKDSKQHKPEERERLSELIKAHSSWKVVIITPGSIDDRKGSTSLNTLEIRAFASLLDDLKPHKAFVDACDVNEVNFHRLLARPDQMRSRAGVRAQGRRELSGGLRRIHSGQGAPGRGDAPHRGGAGRCRQRVYSSDPKTRAFLENWIREKGDLPPHTRRSWATARDMLMRPPRSPSWMTGNDL